MPTIAEKTHEVYLWDADAQSYIKEALDQKSVHEMARFFGNDKPAPAKNAGYDRSLKGTSVMAYYSNPGEILELVPDSYKPHVKRNLQRRFGALEPYIGLNPELPVMGNKLGKGFVYSVLEHEKTHAGQPGKFALKGIYARTALGDMPIGEMIIEGSAEYALERRGKKSPSQYFDEMGSGKALYSYFKEFVYEIEDKSPGITRQILRAAKKGGPYAAMRLIDSVPDIENITNKYAWKLNNRMN